MVGLAASSSTCMSASSWALLSSSRKRWITGGRRPLGCRLVHAPITWLRWLRFRSHSSSECERRAARMCGSRRRRTLIPPLLSMYFVRPYGVPPRTPRIGTSGYKPSCELSTNFHNSQLSCFVICMVADAATSVRSAAVSMRTMNGSPETTFFRVGCAPRRPMAGCRDAMARASGSTAPPWGSAAEPGRGRTIAKMWP